MLHSPSPPLSSKYHGHVLPAVTLGSPTRHTHAPCTLFKHNPKQHTPQAATTQSLTRPHVNETLSPSSLLAATGPDGAISKELWSLQQTCNDYLLLLYNVLSKTGDNCRTLRATVYAKDPSHKGLQLHKIASYPPVTRTGSSASLHEPLLSDADADEMLFVNTVHSELSTSMPNSIGAQCDESCLLAAEELVLLPRSGSLVLPLVTSASPSEHSMVGLLVVTRTPTATVDKDTSVPGLGSSGCSASHCHSSEAIPCAPASGTDAPPAAAGHQAEATPAAPAADGSVWRLPILSTSSSRMLGSCQSSSSGSSRPISLREVGRLPPVPRAAAEQVLSSWTEEELHHLAQARGALARIVSASLERMTGHEATSARAAAARRVLREAQAPVRFINTMSALLQPRAGKGEDLVLRDIASGIATQGQRLQELLRQLDAALLPVATTSSHAMMGQMGAPRPAGSPAQEVPPSPPPSPSPRWSPPPALSCSRCTPLNGSSSSSSWSPGPPGVPNICASTPGSSCPPAMDAPQAPTTTTTTTTTTSRSSPQQRLPEVMEVIDVEVGRGAAQESLQAQ